MSCSKINKLKISAWIPSKGSAHADKNTQSDQVCCFFKVHLPLLSMRPCPVRSTVAPRRSRCLVTHFYTRLKNVHSAPLMIGNAICDNTTQPHITHYNRYKVSSAFPNVDTRIGGVFTEGGRCAHKQVTWNSAGCSGESDDSSMKCHVSGHYGHINQSSASAENTRIVLLFAFYTLSQSVWDKI